MNEELKACSICGAPGVQMWDPEENIIKCSSEGSCHNALYGMYYNEWQSRPLEDALAAKNFELFMSPEAKKYIDDRLSILADGIELIKKSECIMTTGEQHEVIYYLRCMLSQSPVDLDKIPRWLSGLEIIRRNHIVAEKLLKEWVALTRFALVDKYPMELIEKTERFLIAIKTGGDIENVLSDV